MMSAALSDQMEFKSHKREIMLHEVTRATYSECISLHKLEELKLFEHGITGLSSF